MGARGPKSTAQLATVTMMTKRPPPPSAALTADQSEIWKRLATAKPPEHFTADDLPMLAELCRAYDAADKLAVRIDKGIETYLAESLQKLTGMRDKESRRAMALATKLRMSAQSRYDKTVAETLSRQARRSTPSWVGAHGDNEFDQFDQFENGPPGRSRPPANQS